MRADAASARTPQELGLPVLPASIEFHLIGILPDEKDDPVVLVRAIEAALQVDAVIVGVREDLGREVETVDVAPMRRDIEVDHGYVQLGPVVRKLRQLDADALNCR